MKSSLVGRLYVALFAAGPIWFCLAFAQDPGLARPSAPTRTSPSAYRQDRILVQPKPETSLAALADFHAAQKIEVLQTFEGIGRMQVLRVPEGETVPGLIAKHQRSGLVEFAEPDFTGRVFATPNDPKFLDGTLWGLKNTGQNNGTADADID